jgi:hypothetical protein
VQQPAVRQLTPKLPAGTSIPVSKTMLDLDTRMRGLDPCVRSVTCGPSRMDRKLNTAAGGPSPPDVINNSPFIVVFIAGDGRYPASGCPKLVLMLEGERQRKETVTASVSNVTLHVWSKYKWPSAP